ncbi:DUF3800 domain-containing protein [Paenibacillus sp. GCM10023252]|uniref:DUF3800 domain-containing protein n=1 Tax=Paenibacillus sp. GCM10023252 TaxID=3252649 RepID=UPI0036206F42
MNTKKNPIYRFYNSFFSKQTKELSEEQINTFILQSFNNIVKNAMSDNEKFDEIIFIQKFDKELREKLKLDIEACLGRKTTYGGVSFKGKQIAEILLNEFNRIKQEITEEEIVILRNEIIDSGSDIDAKLKFYYDETNNPRKFWIKGSKFNSPVNKNFVLGGIVIDEKKFIGNPKDLHEKLKFQNNINEMKSKHILKLTFIESLRSKQLNIVLKWIFEHEIYIHFINVDNLYAIVNDILKIIINNNMDNEKIKGLELMHGHTLYKHISSNLDEVCEILTKYDYPKIQKDAITDFCEEWVTFIKSLKSKLPSVKDKFEEVARMIVYDELWKLFDKQKYDDDFIGFGKNDYIIKDYSNYYLIKPVIFLNSIHIFDKEPTIEEIINTTNFEKDRNFIFKNSKEDNFIQISDVIVGLLGRFFTYIEELNDEMENGRIVQKLVSSISKFDIMQKENFLLLTNLLKKSHDKNRLFFSSENTFIQRNNMDFIMRIIDITDEEVKFEVGNN